MKFFFNRKVVWGVILMMALFFVILTFVPALAAEEVTKYPWDDVVIVFGAVALSWSYIQMGIIRVLRGVSIGGRPLLATDAMVWVANGILGAIGLTVAATQSGQPFLASIMQAVMAVLMASGQHEILSVTGKKSSPEQSSSTDYPSAPLSTE